MSSPISGDNHTENANFSTKILLLSKKETNLKDLFKQVVAFDECLNRQISNIHAKHRQCNIIEKKELEEIGRITENQKKSHDEKIVIHEEKILEERKENTISGEEHYVSKSQDEIVTKFKEIYLKNHHGEGNLWDHISKQGIDEVEELIKEEKLTSKDGSPLSEEQIKELKELIANYGRLTKAPALSKEKEENKLIEEPIEVVEKAPLWEEAKPHAKKSPKLLIGAFRADRSSRQRLREAERRKEEARLEAERIQREHVQHKVQLFDERMDLILQTERQKEEVLDKGIQESLNSDQLKRDALQQHSKKTPEK